MARTRVVQTTIRAAKYRHKTSGTNVPNVRMALAKPCVIRKLANKLHRRKQMIKKTHAERLVEQYQTQRSALAQSADRHDLIMLRISVARLAQVLHIQTEQLPVREVGSYDDLVTLANQDNGWNYLLSCCVQRVHATC